MLITVKQAAKMLGLNYHQVHYLLVMGYIAGIKVGKAWRVVPDSVQDYADRKAA